MCVRVCGSPVCMSVCDLMYVDLYEAVTRYTVEPPIADPPNNGFTHIADPNSGTEVCCPLYCTLTPPQ